jgi:transcriptional regulator with XRE-family HTH domain
VETVPFNGVPVPGLKVARLRKALTQAQLAHEAAVALSTVARLETGWPAAPGTIRKLADALDVEPEELIDAEYGEARVAERRTPYGAGPRRAGGRSGKGAEAA